MKEVTIENYKNFVGRKIEVEICCYSAGMIYPDENILVGMNNKFYYFCSECGTDTEQYWHWRVTSDEECSISVYDYEEYHKKLT